MDPGVGPGAAITITGGETPDQVAAGVAAEAAAAAAPGAPQAAVTEIHRSGLEKGGSTRSSRVQQVQQVDEVLGLDQSPSH